MRVEQARARAVGQPRREGVGDSVFAHGGTGQAHGAGDAEQRLPIGVPTPHLVVGSPPPLPAFCACFALRCRTWKGAISPGSKSCRSGDRRQTTEPHTYAIQPTFDGLAHVGEQVPAVGDLYGPGSTEAGATGVLGRAVPGHDFDVWSLQEPAGQRRSGAVREEVGDAMPIQVHHDGAVAAALPHRPVVDADVRGYRRVRHRHGPDQAQHRGSARRHAQVRQEPRPGSAAADDADPPLRFGQPTCPPGPRRDEIGRLLGEGAPGAARVGAVKASDLHVQRRS